MRPRRRPPRPWTSPPLLRCDCLIGRSGLPVVGRTGQSNSQCACSACVSAWLALPLAADGLRTKPTAVNAPLTAVSPRAESPRCESSPSTPPLRHPRAASQRFLHGSHAPADNASSAESPCGRILCEFAASRHGSEFSTSLRAWVVVAKLDFSARRRAGQIDHVKSEAIASRPRSPQVASGREIMKRQIPILETSGCWKIILVCVF
jgi:hypothetical protein